MAWAIVAVVVMVLPIPPWLMDLLLTVSISLGVLLLLAAMEVGSVLSFTTFPTLLLLTTLFRLSLNVASTRLILLTANPGEVIRAFGEFVVGGEVLVGLAVFLVITVVQFVVIAKGAERISEVSARFTLDAMPGKQLAIDAEARAGHISPEEAGKRRGLLDRESRFFGAMDGAMKFVKGDAIAALVISLINVIAGMAMGMLSMGMSASEAVHTYTVLTVGDGLVSQIPSLLSAMAAGILVTRVSSGGDRPLGARILEELTPSALPFALGALFLGGAAVVPGMPTVPFAVGAVVLGTVAYTRGRSKGVVVRQEPRALAEEPVSVLMISLGNSLAAHVSSQDSFFLERYVPEALHRVSAKLGIEVPEPLILNDSTLESWEYVIELKGVEVARGMVDLRARVGGPLAEPPKEGWLPFSRWGQWWVYSRDGEAPEAVVALHLESVLLDRAWDLMDIEVVRSMLEAQASRSPHLVAEVHRRHDLATITDVLRRLVEEGVSLRPLQRILEALMNAGGEDPVALLENVRSRMALVIAQSYSIRTEVRYAHVERRIEDEIAVAVTQDASGPTLALDPVVADAIVDGVRSALSPVPDAVLVVSRDVRRFLWRLLSYELKGVVVLSPDELPPNVRMVPVAEVVLNA